MNTRELLFSNPVLLSEFSFDSERAGMRSAWFRCRSKAGGADSLYLLLFLIHGAPSTRKCSFQGEGGGGTRLHFGTDTEFTTEENK